LHVNNRQPRQLVRIVWLRSLLSVFVVGTASLKGGDPSSGVEQSSTLAGNSAAVTIALAVCLGIAVAVLVVVVVVGVVRHLRFSRQLKVSDSQGSVTSAAAPVASDGPARTSGGSLRPWGFASIRSKYSINTDDPVDSQLS